MDRKSIAQEISEIEAMERSGSLTSEGALLAKGLLGSDRARPGEKKEGHWAKVLNAVALIIVPLASIGFTFWAGKNASETASQAAKLQFDAASQAMKSQVASVKYTLVIPDINRSLQTFMDELYNALSGSFEEGYNSEGATSYRKAFARLHTAVSQLSPYLGKDYEELNNKLNEYRKMCVSISGDVYMFNDKEMKQPKFNNWRWLTTNDEKVVKAVADAQKLSGELYDMICKAAEKYNPDPK